MPLPFGDGRYKSNVALWPQSLHGVDHSKTALPSQGMDNKTWWDVCDGIRGLPREFLGGAVCKNCFGRWSNQHFLFMSHCRLFLCVFFRLLKLWLFFTECSNEVLRKNVPECISEYMCVFVSTPCGSNVHFCPLQFYYSDWSSKYEANSNRITFVSIPWF